MTSRSVALRRLLLVAAAVCLLGTGGLHLVRAPAGGAAAAAAGAGAGAEPVPPAAVSALRSALAAVPPLLAGDPAPPGARLDLPLHAAGLGDVPDAVRRAPGATAGGPDLRGPPLTAGT